MGRSLRSITGLLGLVALTFLAGAKEAAWQSVTDSSAGYPEYEIHDVEQVDFRVNGKDLEVRAHFARDFKAMMFQSVALYVDCDKNPKTGIRGAELYVRAAVGSRFRPNSWKPTAAGIKPPLEQRRAGYATLHRARTDVDGRQGLRWVWRRPLPAPTVSGKIMSFRFPVSLIRQFGQRYDSKVLVRVAAESTCSESPIPLRHVVSDEGIEIRVDGKDDDWSGGNRADDELGELHERVRSVGIRKVQVDHGKRALYVGVWLEEAGFELHPNTHDIRITDQITVAVEPLDGGYGRYREHVLHAYQPSVGGKGFAMKAKDGFAEFDFSRRPEDSAFRVVVWSDAIRTDYVPNEGSFEIDVSGGGE